MRAWSKDDYITPPWFLDLVRKVFPGESGPYYDTTFILDLASDNPWMGMPERFMFAKDGLSEPAWAAPDVFINPPYSNIMPWVDKAFEFHDKGCGVLMLLPANTDTKWFHKLATRASLCFWKGRIKFLKPIHGPNVEPDYTLGLREDPSPRHLPLVAFLAATTDQETRFEEVFSPYGTIL